MTVGVFFGGMSCEHDISIITGLQAVSALKLKYNVVPIYIDSKGTWYTGKKYFDINNFKDKASLNGKQVYLKAGDRTLYIKKSKIHAVLDVAVICCHGLNGEDGTLQGLLQLSHVPYTGSGVMASAVGMDKGMMKKIFESVDLPVLPYSILPSEKFCTAQDATLDTLEQDLNYPMIIKPSNLGSSIGISVAKDRTQLVESLTTAFQWDNMVVVEKALTDFIELNCAVLGGKNFDTLCSELEQPNIIEDYLTYDNKYKANDKYNSRNIPANVSIDIRRQVQEYAKTAFSSLNCSGVARCDFLYKDEKLYINEINTIPGSLSNYLFKHSGMSFSTLLANMIDIAISEHKARMRLKYAYDSEVLKNLNLGSKK